MCDPSGARVCLAVTSLRAALVSSRLCGDETEATLICVVASARFGISTRIATVDDENASH